MLIVGNIFREDALTSSDQYFKVLNILIIDLKIKSCLTRDVSRNLNNLNEFICAFSIILTLHTFFTVLSKNQRLLRKVYLKKSSSCSPSRRFSTRLSAIFSDLEVLS